MIIMNSLDVLDSKHKHHCNEREKMVWMSQKITQEKHGISELFKRTAMKIKLLVLTALREN